MWIRIFFAECQQSLFVEMQWMRSQHFLKIDAAAVADFGADEYSMIFINI